MNPFISLFRKEFYALITGGIGFFVLFIYIVISYGLTFYAGNFFSINNKRLYSFFIFQPEVLSLLLPALSMHLWTDESKRGTQDFLLSLPVKYSTLVLAKYSAVYVYGAIMLLSTLPLPLVESYWIRTDNTVLILSYVSVLLVMGIFIAIGSVVSALSSNFILTYIGSFFLIRLLMGLNPTLLVNKIVEKFQGQISMILDFKTIYNSLIMGQAGLNSILYYVSGIVLLLWLNIVIIAHKKD